MLTSELTGQLLNYWVARAEGMSHEQALFVDPAHDYAGEWAFAGPIIFRERISIAEPTHPHPSMWSASSQLLKHRSAGLDSPQYGPHPIIAAMRVHVAATFGAQVPDTVPEIPA